MRKLLRTKIIIMDIRSSRNCEEMSWWIHYGSPSNASVDYFPLFLFLRADLCAFLIFETNISSSDNVVVWPENYFIFMESIPFKIKFSASILSCSLAWKWLEANLHASLKLNKLKWNLPKRRRRWDFPSSSSKLSFLSKFAQPKTNMKFILNLTQTLPYFFLLIFERQKSKFQVRKSREGKTLKNLHNNVAWVSERKTFELVGAEQGDGKSFTGSLEFIARLFLYYEHDKLHLLFSL